MICFTFTHKLESKSTSNSPGVATKNTHATKIPNMHYFHPFFQLLESKSTSDIEQTDSWGSHKKKIIFIIFTHFFQLLESKSTSDGEQAVYWGSHKKIHIIFIIFTHFFSCSNLRVPRTVSRPTPGVATKNTHATTVAGTVPRVTMRMRMITTAPARVEKGAEDIIRPDQAGEVSKN